MERAKGIEPSYAAWEAASPPAKSTNFPTNRLLRVLEEQSLSRLVGKPRPRAGPKQKPPRQAEPAERQFHIKGHYSELMPQPAYYASAELGCYSALGWPMPERILDLFTEFRARTNGLDTLAGNSLLGALASFGLDGMGAAEK
jgi:hypothetical protein